MMTSRKALSALAVFLCLSSLVQPALAASRPLGAESPQALAKRLTAAAEAGDFGEIAACLEPGARAEMALGLVAGVAMMMSFMQMGAGMGADMAQGMAEGLSEEGLTPEQKAEIEKAKKEATEKMAGLQKRFEAVLAKHSLTELAAGAPMPGEATPEEAMAKLKGVDQVALLEDLIGVMSDLSPETKETMKPNRDLYGEITDLKVEGDSATARSGSHLISMVKIDGRWYLKPTNAAPAGAPAGG
jgi:hypothetical protein